MTIDLQARVNRFSPHVKAHLSVLGGLVLASKAFDYWLQIYELNFSPRGQVLGASFTDVNAQLPALYILIAIALVWLRLVDDVRLGPLDWIGAGLSLLGAILLLFVNLDRHRERLQRLHVPRPAEDALADVPAFNGHGAVLLEAPRAGARRVL